MSGFGHPINFANPNSIKVTPLEFNSVIATEKARILVDSMLHFEKGDPLELIEVSVNEQIPTGRSIVRSLYR